MSVMRPRTIRGKRALTKAPRRQPKDPALPGVRGVITCKVFCISMPPNEMAAIDAVAERLGMNRSQFLRAGARALITSTCERAEEGEHNDHNDH